jgi:hypothetical protein
VDSGAGDRWSGHRDRRLPALTAAARRAKRDDDGERGDDIASHGVRQRYPGFTRAALIYAPSGAYRRNSCISAIAEPLSTIRSLASGRNPLVSEPDA